MIDVFINGERKSIDEKSDLAAVLIANNFNFSRIAVAVNSEFVTRGEYSQRFLKFGDMLDVVVPVAGG